MALASLFILAIDCKLKKEELAGAKKKPVGFTIENVLKQKIRPEIIDEAPKETIEVKYPSGILVKFGNLLKPIQVKDEPEFSYIAEKGQLYTLFMIDPDAPSREDHKLRNVVHFLRNNIPENRTRDGELAVEYVGACPAQGTGIHRMIFLLYKQPNGERIEFEEVVDKHSLRGRGPLSLRDYADDNKLGEPVAINFFMSDYDSHVPVIYSQFSIFG